ncbi:MAG: TonB-dependent receptor [Acidobacteria bacterium]|nr:TonB-dependent receptor [Acidobacteriota bacterium]
MQMLTWLILAVALAFSASSASPAMAQAPAPPTISGIVVDAGTRAPIPGAKLSANRAEATTDAAGRFMLPAVVGRATVLVDAAGYFALATDLDVPAAGLTGAELALARDTGFATTVAVIAPSPAAAPATTLVAPVEVLRTPGALDNIYRTLQTLPGVAATEEFGSRLAVRGGSPDQNLTVMDGVEIHDPYRLFGLTSAFNPETIQRFELATGGFSAQYGDRLSSLLVVENRDGTRTQAFGGSASLSITDANLVVEGRLPGKAVGSWLVTGRRTYYDLVASRITNQEFPAFGDLQGKGVWEPSPGRKVTLFGLRSRQAAAIAIDEADARGEFQDDTENDLAWARFDTSLGSRGQSHTVVSYSDTRSTFGVDASFENTHKRSNAPSAESYGTANVVFERALSVKDVAARQEFAWALGAHVLAAGAEAHRLSTALRYEITGDRNPGAANGSSVQGGAGLPDLLASAQQSTRAGAWIQDTFPIGSRGSLQAGLRWDGPGTTGESLFSPRLTASFRLASSTHLRAAAGRYTQSPGYEKLAQSDYVLDFTDENLSRLRSERATQASAGVERDLPGGAALRVEGYYKRFTDLLIGQLETEPARLARVSRYDFPAALQSSIPVDPLITTIPGNDGHGRSYGFDVFLSRTGAPAGSRVTGWASYTWGKTSRDGYGRRYDFEYDRRHAFTTVAAYRFTPQWELASTIRVASGFPRTAPLGVRVAAIEDTLDRDGDGVTDELLPERDAAGRLVYAVNFGGAANLNQARLPVFARVDVRATWRPRGAAGRWEFYAEIINLLNRKNAGALEPRLDYDSTADRPRIVEQRDQSIPRLPTVGIRFRF